MELHRFEYEMEQMKKNQLEYVNIIAENERTNKAKDDRIVSKNSKQKTLIQNKIIWINIFYVTVFILVDTRKFVRGRAQF